jgi:hypothetical protein
VRYGKTEGLAPRNEGGMGLKGWNPYFITFSVFHATIEFGGTSIVIIHPASMIAFLPILNQVK